MKNIYLPIFVAVAVAALSSCSKPNAPAPPTPKVTVAHPHSMTVTNWDEFPGHVEAIEEVQLRPRVSGYIDSIHFQDGAEVKKGDLLFQIDPRPYQAEVERAKAEREGAETRLELARNDLKRSEVLRGTRAISLEELDNRAKAAREAEDALKAARAGEAAAQLNLDYTRVTAPINGRISRRMVTAGNLVQPSMLEPLTTIVSVAPIYCYFDVPEEAFLHYRANSQVGGDTGAAMLCELKLANEAEFVHRGHVDFFDNQVNRKTGTIRMRAVFPNKDRSLIPGIFATVRVPAGPPVETLTVPATAIGADQNYKFVMVVNSSNIVETKTVTVGRAHGQLRAILKGLTPQDRVIVNGLVMARPGAKVEPQDAGAAKPNSAAADQQKLPVKGAGAEQKQ